MTLLLLIAAFGAPDPDIIALDNGLIRVEVDPKLFTVQYVGFSGGTNFVEVIHVEPEVRQGADWVDAGGLQTDLVPYAAQDAALKRGPAEVLERRDDCVVLLGPVSQTLPIRLKKEVRLEKDKPKATFTVAAISTSTDPVRFALCNVVRVPQGNTLRIEKADGEMRPLEGTESTTPTVLDARESWRIPVPPTTRIERAVLGAFVPEFRQRNQSGTWIRRLVTMPARKEDVPLQCTFVALLDDDTRKYAAVFQSAMMNIDAISPAVFEEEWTLEPSTQ